MANAGDMMSPPPLWPHLLRSAHGAKGRKLLPPMLLKGDWKLMVDRVAWLLHNNRLRGAATLL